MRNRSAAVAFLTVLLAAAPAAAQVGSAEARTARWFDSIRDDYSATLIFLRGMPKGGDLHNHLSGAVYAESFIQWAADAGLCIDMATAAFRTPPCAADAGAPPAASALTNPALYDLVIDGQSMRNWHPSRSTGHDQFFDSFDKFRLVSRTIGPMLAEATSRAADGRLSYMELMVTPDGSAAGNLGRSIGWDGSVQRTRERLLAAGLRDTLANASVTLDSAIAQQRRALRCDSPAADPGCDVTVRILYQVARARAPELVFAQILAGFEMATRDPRVVGLNLVQPEDHPVAMRDYSLHMRMIGELRSLYPQVKVTLHAGELASGLVPPEGLRFHIREAVRVAGAQRIGHGVDIAHEDSVTALLDEMARRGVLVEIALGSNDAILGVRGNEHPLALYMRAGVPVSLATDDEGVLRSEMTMEYLKAVREQGLGYIDLKTLARNSLEYAFVDGESLWVDARRWTPRAECAASLEAAACMAVLNRSTKARLQADLERRFIAFEAGY